MTPEQQEQLAEGTLLSHLTELRNRLFKAFGAVFAVFLVMIPFAQEIYVFASAPLASVVPGGRLQSFEALGPLTATFGLLFYLAIFFSMPVILYQAWAFVAPGLYRKEKRFAFPLLATSIVLFYTGMAFAYFVLFPLIFGFITAFTPESVQYQPDMGMYVSFIMRVFLVFGLAFETPVAVVLLVWTGLTTTEKLAKARPYVFLGAFVIGMFLTPPDAISQTMLAVPVYLLFEAGILMSRLFSRKPEESGAVSDTNT